LYNSVPHSCLLYTLPSVYVLWWACLCSGWQTEAENGRTRSLCMGRGRKEAERTHTERKQEEKASHGRLCHSLPAVISRRAIVNSSIKKQAACVDADVGAYYSWRWDGLPGGGRRCSAPGGGILPRLLNAACLSSWACWDMPLSAALCHRFTLLPTIPFWVFRRTVCLGHGGRPSLPRGASNGIKFLKRKEERELGCLFGVKNARRTRSRLALVRVAGAEDVRVGFLQPAGVLRAWKRITILYYLFIVFFLSAIFCLRVRGTRQTAAWRRRLLALCDGRATWRVHCCRGGCVLDTNGARTALQLNDAAVT